MPPARMRPAQVEGRRKQERAYRLWMAGMSYQEIADSVDPVTGAPLYTNKGSAHTGVKAAIGRHTGSDDTKIARERNHVRYEAIIRALWPKVLGGDNWAIDRALATLRQEEELLGLKAPIRQQIEVLTTDDVDAAIRDLNEKIARQEADLAALDAAVDAGPALDDLLPGPIRRV